MSEYSGNVSKLAINIILFCTVFTAATLLLMRLTTPLDRDRAWMEYLIKHNCSITVSNETPQRRLYECEK